MQACNPMVFLQGPLILNLKIKGKSSVKEFSEIKIQVGKHLLKYECLVVLN